MQGGSVDVEVRTCSFVMTVIVAVVVIIVVVMSLFLVNSVLQATC